MQDNAHGRINVAKGGIVYSNIVTTVSPTYALEVRSEVTPATLFSKQLLQIQYQLHTL
jgi:glycogen synthase